jgi:hypothetical protein
MSISSLDTKQMTAEPLQHVPAEIQVVDGSSAFARRTTVNNIDILNLEAHGNAVTNEIEGVTANEFAAMFAPVKLALLWSCSSGAVNSWGESPALCLHRSGADVVVSFLADRILPRGFRACRQPRSRDSAGPHSRGQISAH